MRYSLYVHANSLKELPKTGVRRETVLAFFEFLEENHHLNADETRIDPETGRDYFVSTIAGFTIQWWVDSPVREVKIVKIESASP